MSTWIGLIPEEQDHVWKVSSEKIPHMTMLFLGDIPEDQQEHVTKFVQHVADTVLKRCWLSVDRRGELGDDKADVLFFKKDKNAEWLNDVRTNLLADPVIEAAYRAKTQFEGWTPHLTLGFPESPAKEDDNDYGIYGVRFDRLAIWYGDFEGPEFVLEDPDDSIAWSLDNLTVDDVLEHFGIKGQRWGVRRSEAQLAKDRGKDLPASEDAVNAVRAAQKVKAAGSLNVLSSKELQTLVDRMNLEQKYIKATTESTPQQKKADGFIKRTLKNEVSTFQQTGAPSKGVQLLATLLEQQSRAVGYKGAGKRKLTKP